jgi:uncharacterized protein
MTEIDVRDLVGAPGASRTVQVSEPMAGLRTELASVPEDRQVNVHLLMESVVEGILASGPVSGVMTLRCARCLTTFDQDFRIEVSELFTRGAAPDDDE